MMKKMILSLFGLVIIALVLVGCSEGSTTNTGEEGDEEIEVNAIFPEAGGVSESIEEITAQFEEENPGVNVNLTFVSYDSLKQKILTSAQAGEYDVAVIDQPWVAQFASADIIEQAPESLSAEEEADIFTPLIESSTYEDTLYTMPWLNDIEYFFYNEQMVEDAGFSGPPTTWEELVEQSNAMIEQGIVDHPMVWSWNQAEGLVCDFAVVAGSYGGGLMDDDQNVSLDSTENQEALQFMYEGIESGIFNPNSTEYSEDDVQNTFISGKAAFAINWTYMYDNAKDPEQSQISDDVGVALIPGTDAAKSASINGGMGLGITSGSENPDEAWEFIRYLTSKEMQQSHVGITLPIWKSLYEDEEVLKVNPELVVVSQEQFQYLESRPMVPEYGELSTAIQIELQNVLIGNKTAEQGLADSN